MKSKTITHVILEGVDGVGKNTLVKPLVEKFNYSIDVYSRGELSNYVYAKLYNRHFISTQRGLPFLYVLLVADYKTIDKRLRSREINEESFKNEIKKFEEQKLFVNAAYELKNDYHIIICETSDLSIEDTVNKIYDMTTKYINNLNIDDEINEYNKIYQRGAQKYGIKMDVRGNQPFFNNKMVMMDAQLHNGDYETFSDHSCPTSLIYAEGYNEHDYHTKKIFDFAYPINSKINVRNEVYDYYDVLLENDMSILVGDSNYISNNEHFVKLKKCFGDEYIRRIATAKATIFTCRDLAYLKCLTARIYEAIFANQIIFVDKKTDPECEILNQIYPEMNEKWVIDILYVDETSIVENYNSLDETTIELILQRQHEWYNKLVEEMLNDTTKM